MPEIKQKSLGPQIIDSADLDSLEGEVLIQPMPGKLPSLHATLARQGRTPSRSELTRHFTETLLEDFVEHGASAIEACRLTKPDVYCKIIAGMLPKEIEIRPESTMSDNELNAALLRYLAADFAKLVEEPARRPVEAPTGAGSPQEPQSTGEV